MVHSSNPRLETGLVRHRRGTTDVFSRAAPLEWSCALAKLLRRTLILIGCGLVLVCAIPSIQVKAQTLQPAADFRGTWRWAVYAKSRAELPPAYRDENLKDVPAAAVELTLTQKGDKLTGEYSASRRFLARVEDGEVDSNIKGNVARLELTSGFGGTVTVLLTLLGNRLHWKTIKSEGESYFPDDVYLSRVVRRKKRH
ncbi:MAG: hypothetical protein JWM21_2249 [Acidobacteria bacterium]|nr:hypothetical protein [Acidobacteriota bacterium]